MIRIVDCDREDFRQALHRRAAVRDSALERTVTEIIDDVRSRGDAALLEVARRFDAPDLESITVTEDELRAAKTSPDEEAAIRTAWERILNFHRRQLDVLTESWGRSGPGWQWQVNPETNIGQRMIPLQRIGIYVPGGGAVYPSSVLMLAGPAKAAGVEEIICATPSRNDGTLSPAVLVALRIAGVQRAYKIGGAAAIAALAFGTDSIPTVDKIAGPGNRFVNEAKRQLWGSVGLDGYAGPSEVCVLADESANATFAAADLLTQIEHAPDNAGFLVCLSRVKLGEILREVDNQLARSPRAEVMRTALAERSFALLARDTDEAIQIVNSIAPEHLTLALGEPDQIVPRIRNAGCILIGDWTPESAADYCLGPSHTLPTGGAARFSGPVTVLDFLKINSFARLNHEQLSPLIPVIETFAAMEGLPIHGQGGAIRDRA